MVLALAFTADDSDETDLTTYTFAGMSFGTAATDRIVAVAAHVDGDGGDLVSATLGGVGATVVITQGVGNENAAIAYAAVPTGTTGDVVVTWTGTAARCHVGVWKITGATAAPTDTDFSTSTPSTGESLTLNIPSHAAAISVHTSTQDSSSDFWTGAVQRYLDASANSEFQGADVQPTGIDRPTHTVSTSYSSLSQGAVLVGAVWVGAPGGIIIQNA